MKHIAVSKSGFAFLDKNNKLTDNINTAFRFPTIGDAMRACIEINDKLGMYCFRTYPIYTSDSNNPKC